MAGTGREEGRASRQWTETGRNKGWLGDSVCTKQGSKAGCWLKAGTSWCLRRDGAGERKEVRPKAGLRPEADTGMAGFHGCEAVGR